MTRLAIILTTLWIWVSRAFFPTIILFCSQAAAQRGLTVDVHSKADTKAPVIQNVELYSESYALVIGIDNYTNGWPRLSEAVRDAKLVAAEMKNKGFNVILKTDLKSNELEQAFKEFFILKGEQPDARLFVWFAGHGHTIDNEGFLIPADAPLPNKGVQFKFKALSMRRFGELVRLAQSKHALAVFDACFSGTIFTTQRSIPPAAITRATTLPVRQFLASGDANQQVSDDGRFRKLFLRALRGEEHADANDDGYLTGSELGMYLTDRITNLTQTRQTPRYGKLRDENYDRGDFVFKIASSAAVLDQPLQKENDTTLSVKANREGARVSIDGRDIGQTPLSGIGVTSGNHTVRVELDGYLPYTKNIVFKKGRKKTLTVFLDTAQSSSAALYIDTTPDNAQVRILNIKPKFEQGIILTPGRYHIHVSAPGHNTYEEWITLEAGENRDMDIRLNQLRSSLKPSDSAPTPPLSSEELKRTKRFIVYADQTVLDLKTGLMWPSRDNGKAINWRAAHKFCETFTGGGYSDWRMPTQEELSTLFDKTQKQDCNSLFNFCKITNFIDLTECCPWAKKSRNNEGAGFNFVYGNETWIFKSRSDVNRVLPVRSAR